MDIQRSVGLLSALAININVPLLIVLIILLAFSAFFSMSETVFASVNVVRLRLAVEERKAGARKALYCAEHFDRVLTTVLVGNNVVNISMATVGVIFFGKLLNEAGYTEIVSTVVITLLVLIFGEIAPKTIAKRYSYALSLKMSFFIYLFMVLLFPLVWVFMRFQKLISSKEADQHQMGEDELEVLLDNMEVNGKIEEGELNLIRNVFDLNDRSVSDIMVPRIEMVAINIDTPIEEVTKILLENQFSRVPLFKEDKDHIIGILYERDYFAALISKKNFTLNKIMRPVKYVSAAMKVDALIKELQLEKMHIAVVSGEYGDTLGIVTMEDALEEIVGEIYDEHDDAGGKDLMFKELGDDSYLVDGEMYLDELFERLDIGNPPEDSSYKLATWMFERCEDIPVVGYKYDYIASYVHLDEMEDEYNDYNKKLSFEIAEVKGRRIKLVKVSIFDVSQEELENMIKTS